MRAIDNSPTSHTRDCDSSRDDNPELTLVSRLTSWDLVVLGQVAESSNYTFLCKLTPPVMAGLQEGSRLDHGDELLAIFKPVGGERPLWDFPPGLFRREIAAYRMSQLLGWDLVPVTLERSHDQLGTGSLQLFIQADFSLTYFELFEQNQYRDQLVRLAIFDILVNNSDRKAGHVLIDSREKIWAIDNGLSFHEEPKLRTVIWDFQGEPIEKSLIAQIESALSRPDRLNEQLEGLITERELKALSTRARALVDTPFLPYIPQGTRPFPWPLI